MRRNGFTLIELMTSMGVLALVTLYLTDMLVQQSRTYEVVDTVTESQQSLRAVAQLMDRDLRQTGGAVAEGGAFCGIDGDLNGADIVFTTDSDAVTPIDPATNNLLVISAENGVTINEGNYNGTNQDTIAVDFLTVEGTGGVAAYDNDADGNPDSDFYCNLVGGNCQQFGGVILADRKDPGRGTQCGILADVQIGANPRVTVDWRIQVNGITYNPGPNPLPAATPGQDTELVLIPANFYLIVQPAAANGTPSLMRNGMVIADDVEDLQFAAFYDGDGDGNEDAGEWPGTTGDGQYVSNAEDNGDLRRVRVSFVSRTQSQDPDVVAGALPPTGLFQTLENRGGPPPWYTLATDGFRRRVYTRSVRLRNVGLRPGSL